MKINLLIGIILLLFLASCESKSKESSSDVNLELPQKNEEVRTGYDVIYSNKNCLKPEVDTNPIIQLEKNYRNNSGFVSGKAFFSNNYLRSIAWCNQIDYKIQLAISNPKIGFVKYFEEKLGDTIYFKIPCDSLEVVSADKIKKEYLLKGRLMASFFKANKVSGYDTIMPVKLNVLLAEKQK